MRDDDHGKVEFRTLVPSLLELVLIQSVLYFYSKSRPPIIRPKLTRTPLFSLLATVLLYLPCDSCLDWLYCIVLLDCW